MSKKKEIEVKQENQITTQEELNSWGKPTITSKDMIIPKILPLQHMSDKVKDKQGEYGDFRDTLSNEKFGDIDNPFEIIPFLLHKKWIEFSMIPQKNGGFKREFLQVLNIQDDPTKPGYNDDLPLREENGTIERDRIMDFFVLIPKEVEEDRALPYVVSFRRTSLKGGQKLATQMYVRNAASNKVPPATVMLLCGLDKENDDGNFVVQDVVPKRLSTPKEIAECFKWYKIIQGGGVKVDEREFAQQEAPPVQEVTDF